MAEKMNAKDRNGVAQEARLAKRRRTRRERPPSPSWVTFQEIADHFLVGEASVRLGRGVFARLRRVQLTDKRIVVLRKDFEQLDRDMEKVAVSLDG